MSQINETKFKEVLLYILNKVAEKPNVGETVLYKLLYFIDFNYYEKYEEPLTGASYMKNQYGPTPKEFKAITEDMIGKEIEKKTRDYYGHPQTYYTPLRKADLKKLTPQEVGEIDSVLEKLSDMNAAEISEYSHHDVPWITTEDLDIIDYESVFYRTREYSVRVYAEEF